MGSLVKQAGTFIEEPAGIERSLAGALRTAPRAPGIIIAPTRRAALSAFTKASGLRRRLGQPIRSFGESIERKYETAAQKLPPTVASKVAGALTGTVVQTAPSLAAGMAAGIITKSPTAGMTVAGLAAGTQTYSQMLSDGVERLMSKNPSLTRQQAVDLAMPGATLAGVITGVLTRYFPGGAERMAIGTGQALAKLGLTKEALAGGIREWFKETGLEVGEEWLDQFSQGVIEKATTNPEKTLWQIVNEADIAGAGAIFITSMMSGGKPLARKLLPSEEEQPARPATPHPIPPSQISHGGTDWI